MGPDALRPFSLEELEVEDVGEEGILHRPPWWCFVGRMEGWRVYCATVEEEEVVGWEDMEEAVRGGLRMSQAVQEEAECSRWSIVMLVGRFCCAGVWEIGACILWLFLGVLRGEGMGGVMLVLGLGAVDMAKFLNSCARCLNGTSGEERDASYIATLQDSLPSFPVLL